MDKDILFVALAPLTSLLKKTLKRLNWNPASEEVFSHLKKALEEWRHWLEGSTHPFIIYTDHKSLGSQYS